MTEQQKLAKQVFDKMMENDHCSRWMGFEAICLDEGYCKLSMKVKKEMLNGYGILHGGIAFAFADSAFAFASNSYGRVAVSIEGKMSYNKSAKIDEVLYAETKALKVGNRLATFDVNLYNEAGLVYYLFEVRYLEWKKMFFHKMIIWKN